jgi:23S rRNA U2552 (ribose-2'-O)-methylase RlmE/FtsJ
MTNQPYMAKSGETDKYWSGYVPTYEALARTIQPRAAICELGVYEGGSLKLWKQIFPNYQLIVGVDINEHATWPEGTVRVVADQQDPLLVPRLERILGEHIRTSFDLIVDDASHIGHLTYKAFLHLWPLVVPGGYYVIEDWLVGFPRWSNFDDSMVHVAMMLLNEFDPDQESDVHFITYQAGLVVIRKKDVAQEA